MWDMDSISDVKARVSFSDNEIFSGFGSDGLRWRNRGDFG
ncbi:hypothetical protein HMPREF0281_00257 [Corynebacterium ammoniagenes DSM 20306]|uniref:Uncharacterized protein n=1 Tax=Corynebacterium ammoniagenes DSM 20306 TaxID=649754 RepID=A0ABP2IGT5_CORAM|nr:hypothetical protein HMPREF0281_00257 [Corynebacterium ammoniagenes DSM 20306]